MTMQPLDAHRANLGQLIASIRAWSGFVADVAKVEMQEVGQGWRLAMQPATAGACPFELVLDGAALKCDLRVGQETYEDVPLPSLDIVLPLTEAVTEGKVVTRQMVSAATGLPLQTSTLITLADGRRLELPAETMDQDIAAVTRAQHYLPYRKPA